MRLGFQYPSPFERIPNWRYGDDDWTVTIRQRGKVWTYSSLMARAHFGPERPAEPFTDHPGEIGLFAQLHIELNPGDLGDKIVLNSRQVSDLIGPTTEVAA